MHRGWKTQEFRFIYSLEERSRVRPGHRCEDNIKITGCTLLMMSPQVLLQNSYQNNQRSVFVIELERGLTFVLIYEPPGFLQKIFSELSALLGRSRIVKLNCKFLVCEKQISYPSYCLQCGGQSLLNVRK